MRSTRIYRLFALSAALCVISFAAAAQQQALQQAPLQDLPPLQRPLLGPEYTRLAFLVGAWEEAITYPGAQMATGTGRWIARPVLGDFLMINYEGRGPQGPYRAQGVLTYDRELKLYRMWWFDDTGGIGDYRGIFVDMNTLVLEHQAKKDGRDFRERITYVRVAPGEVRTKIEQAWDAEEYKTSLEAVARRGPGAMGGPGRGPRPPN